VWLNSIQRLVIYGLNLEIMRRCHIALARGVVRGGQQDHPDA